MSPKRRRVPKPPASTPKLPTGAPPVIESTNHLAPVFQFSQCADSGKYAAHEMTKQEIKALIACFKKAEKHTWQQIEATGGPRGLKTGLGYTRLKRSELPADGSGLSEDVRDGVFELRVSRTARILCFRDDRICHVLWFDRNHSIKG